MRGDRDMTTGTMTGGRQRCDGDDTSGRRTGMMWGRGWGDVMGRTGMVTTGGRQRHDGDDAMGMM